MGGAQGIDVCLEARQCKMYPVTFLWRRDQDERLEIAPYVYTY